MENCPRCKQKAEALNALSRHDGTTKVCDSCGIDEAMRDNDGQQVWPGHPGLVDSWIN